MANPDPEALREGALRCIRDWARVQPGEQVLLFYPCEPYLEPGVRDTFLQVCQELGARVSEVRCPTFNPRVEEPPPPAARALEGADVCFYFSPYPAFIHCHAAKRAMLEYGLRLVPVLAHTAELLASEWARFPVDILLELHRRSTAFVHRNPRLTVTARNGTRLVGTAPTVNRVQRDVCIHGLAWHGIWPGECGPCLAPMQDCTGELVVDVLPGFPGFLETKVHITLRDGRIVAIEGGREAEWFRQMIEEHVRRGADADVLFELQWGLNPKGRIERAVQHCLEDEVELSRCARTVHFGFGSGQHGFHWDVVIVDGFDIVNGEGEYLYRDGRLTLLDDPDIRAMAARYSDPDQVLREVSEVAVP